jgi:DHA3 family tetracycline resistance protein-like MFS transporter
MSLWSSLRHRPFALLWTGQTVSRVGDSLQTIALTWYLVEKTGSATAISRLLIFAFVPNILFLLIGGVAVDRFPRVRVMLLSDLFRGLLVGGVAALAFTNRLELWHLYASAIVFGFVDAFFQPAYVAAVPELTPAELLPSANALTSLSGRAIGVVGPAIGALLVKLGGTSTAFAIDALSFLISAACLLPLPRTGVAHQNKQQPGVLADIREGVQAVLASPWLWVTIALFSLINITQSGPLGIALPLLIKNSLGGGVDVLGLFSSMSALGAVLTAIWMGRIGRLHRRGLLAYGAPLIGGLMTAAIGFPVGLPGLLLAAFIIGSGITVFSLIWTNTLQEMVPQALLGRVSSVDQLGSFVLLPIGYAAAGWLTDRIGPPSVFVLGGTLTALLLGLGLLHPAIRKLD